MTIQINPDSLPENAGKTRSFYFGSSDEAMTAGVRVRPADLARLFGVTKQAVSAWVKDGRIVLGVDGRVDPRDAVNRLIATGNPARLRAIFLKPLITEIDEARRRIADLEQSLVDLNDESEFNRNSASGMIDLFEIFKDTLEDEWHEIRELPSQQGLDALLGWLDDSIERGADHGITILDLAARSVAEEEGEALGVIKDGEEGL